MSKQRGFTMLEIVIVVAIVAILAAIALPNYTEFLIRSRVPEAHANLSTMRVRAEQYFQDQNTYVGVDLVPNFCAPTANFTYNCGAPGANTYTFTATGAAGTPVAGLSYTIDQADNRTSTVGAGAPPGWTANANCWTVRKAGSCS